MSYTHTHWRMWTAFNGDKTITFLIGGLWSECRSVLALCTEGILYDTHSMSLGYTSYITQEQGRKQCQFKCACTSDYGCVNKHGCMSKHGCTSGCNA